MTYRIDDIGADGGADAPRPRRTAGDERGHTSPPGIATRAAGPTDVPGGRAFGWAEPSGTALPLEGLLDGAPLPLPRVLMILRDVARQLDRIAGAGNAYGAVSPSSIVVEADGSAALLPPTLLDALRPGYLAPEQRHGEFPDARLDQYALGIVAYEMLTGERREVRVDAAAHLDAVNEVRLGPEHALRPGFGPGVNDVIRRAMARDPSWRFETATAFVDALAAQLDVPPPAVRVDEDLLGRAVAARYERALKSRGTASGSSLTGRVLGMSTFVLTSIGGLLALTWLLSSVVGGSGARLGPGIDQREGLLAGIARRLNAGNAGRGSGTTGSSPATLAVGHVRVSVEGVASAAVQLDGRPAGIAPGLISTTAGTHLIELSAPGRSFLPAVSTVRVSAGDTTDASFTVR